MVKFHKYTDSKDILCVFFSGLAKGFIHIDWHILNYNVLLLWTGDYQNHMYYTEGISGFSSNEQETADKISQLGAKYKRIALIGSSMGAYGALSCYKLLKCDKDILVFNPKVNITYNTSMPYDHIPLRQNLGGYYDVGTRWCVHGIRYNDIKQANLLKGFQKIQYPTLEHSMLISLKENELLNPIVISFLSDLLKEKGSILNQENILSIKEQLSFKKY
jgi:hypothetical protein